jgi:hypothetical protein
MHLSFKKVVLVCLTLVAFGAMWVSNSSCKKQQLLESGGDVGFSTDTLTFDTVFTAIGAATQTVKIYNRQDQKIVLSSVRLEGGDASFFSLNVDGRSGKSAKDIEIAANDSVYVFATVKVDPTNANTPFIIEDKLTATLNGRDFSIPVFAYGQNAHFITDSVLQSATWINDKPYVIFGYAVVDSEATLTIKPGCRIYMHQNARMFVDGTLDARGTKQDSIIFQGDRLDRAYFGYQGYPGEWGGIYFTQRSKNNYLEHVILKNGGNTAQGAPAAMIEVAPDTVANRQIVQLQLNKVIIENSIGYGLLSFTGTITAQNCLIHSCGASALALVQGGNYSLEHCTITTYGNNKIAHNDNPAAVILNYYPKSPTENIVAALTCTLNNCVVSGSLTDEFVADSIDGAVARLLLEGCVLKTSKQKIRPWVSEGQKVQYISSGTTAYDSLFSSVSRNDYHPASVSTLIKGGVSTTLSKDLDENDRPIDSPDVGCYQNIR